MPHLEDRLKVIPLCPFIPSVDEQKRLWQLVEGLLISKQGAQPMAVSGRSEAIKVGGAAVPSASGVDPGGGDEGEAEVGHCRAGQHGVDDVGVREHAVVAERMGAGQAELVEQVPAARQGPLEVCPSSPGVRRSAPVWCAGLAQFSWPCRSRTQPLQRI
jgi:hypothetical protein